MLSMFPSTYIARHVGLFQRLHGELPLTADELENVFDTLDADGNGYLTLEEFSTGFSELSPSSNVYIYDDSHIYLFDDSYII